MYKISRKANNTWVALDTSHDFSVTFVEGLYNETQQAHYPDWLKDAGVIAGLHRHIADWCALNHRNLCVCNVAARRKVFEKISKVIWWEALAELDRAMLQMLTALPTAEGLTSVVRMHQESTKKPLSLDESALLLDTCASLTREEVSEVQTILLNRLVEPQRVSIWAKDLLKWTSQIVEDKPYEGILKVLRQIMKEKGINQQQLSDLAGINISNVNRVLSGKTSPRIDTIITIAEALGVEIRINRK